MKKKVLFLCTGNSCRSQMAEGWLRHLHGQRFEAFSAGIAKHGMNQYAIQAMKEIGVDLSAHHSKLLSELESLEFDLVVTVCSNAHESCPLFPGKAKVVHVPFDDPPALAVGLSDSEEIMVPYRRVRDQIGEFVKSIDKLIDRGNSMEIKILHDDKIKSQVSQRYGSIAKAGNSCCSASASGCCQPDGIQQVSEKLGYSSDEVSSVPEGANMGLGCGNPQAIASLKPGENVLDLGSGGGFDCFLAAKAVGPSGMVIGVDMTPEMLSKARKNAVNGGYSNVDFRLGEIEHLPLADNSVDVIISNCVINLSPDKESVFREAFRVLRSNGRIAVSDVVAFKPLTEELRNNLDAYCGCIAGAATVNELEAMLKMIGFANVRIEIKPESRNVVKDWFKGAEDFVCSANIMASKP
ncbi:MAG TPA: hypothetical protein DCG57_12650 [Candidatus Riflebacteria bacterium]|jgi:thioredoxin type arsenate reductase|nr:hypothetical protein [Candidatus Riflebacteria bacterium]